MSLCTSFSGATVEDWVNEGDTAQWPIQACIIQALVYPWFFASCCCLKALLLLFVIEGILDPSLIFRLR